MLEPSPLLPRVCVSSQELEGNSERGCGGWDEHPPQAANVQVHSHWPGPHQNGQGHLGPGHSPRPSFPGSTLFPVDFQPAEQHTALRTQIKLLYKGRKKKKTASFSPQEMILSLKKNPRNQSGTRGWCKKATHPCPQPFQECAPWKWHCCSHYNTQTTTNNTSAAILICRTTSHSHATPHVVLGTHILAVLL